MWDLGIIAVYSVEYPTVRTAHATCTASVSWADSK